MRRAMTSSHDELSRHMWGSIRLGERVRSCVLGSLLGAEMLIYDQKVSV